MKEGFFSFASCCVGLVMLSRQQTKYFHAWKISEIRTINFENIS
jgi:hypothetical protein